MRGRILGIFLCFLTGCTPAAVLPVQNAPPSQQASQQTQLTQQPAPQPQPQDVPPYPLENGAQRVTKKPFGIKVSPQDSPVQPERFAGYHTGVDFETFADEQDQDVAVSAICAGKILVKRTAQGYGGVLVESCRLNNQNVTVIYGHLKLTGIQKQVGDTLQAGETFAVLGKGFSAETSGERKHLHLGIHKGAAVNIRGYVQQKSELSAWMDFQRL